MLASEPVRVIFDTDMNGDWDDVGALAVLHAAADRGEAEILATTVTAHEGQQLPVVEVINAFYGRADIPVGVARKGANPGFDGYGVLDKYAFWVRHPNAAGAPLAVDVWRKALEGSPDKSVVLCAVGPFGNLADFLAEPGARALLERKLAKTVLMGCRYPKGRECNSSSQPEASRKVFEEWPGEITFADFESGWPVYSGRALVEERWAALNPVRDIFLCCTKPRATCGKWTWDRATGHPSWDEVAVLASVMPAKEFDKLYDTCRGTYRMVGTEGENVWTDDAKGRHVRLVFAEDKPPAAVGRAIDRYMKAEPKQKARALVAARFVWPQGREAEPNAFAGFAGTFDWDGKADVKIRLAAADCYRLTVNGAFVATGPARAPKGFLRADEFDLAKHLKPGANRVAIEVSCYNKPNFAYVPHTAALAAEVLAGGRPVLWTAPTAGGFTARTLPCRRAKTAMFSSQRGWLEEYDLAPDSFAWRTDGFAAGDVVAEVADDAVIPRGVPNLTFAVKDDFACKRNAKGDWYDGGVSKTGHLGFSLDAQRPCTVEVAFTEWPKDDVVDPIRNCWISPDKTITNILTNARFLLHLAKPGRYDFESIEPNAMRAVQFNASEPGAVRVVRKPYLRLVENPIAGGAKFASSDPALDRVFAAAVSTFAQNAADGYTDCPSRERAIWNGDAYFIARAARMLTGCLDYDRWFFSNFAWPENYDPLPQGVLPKAYPAATKGDFIPNWGMFFVLQLADYTAATGDRTWANAMAPRVFAWVEYLRRYRNELGLLEAMPSWAFLEWSAANEYVHDVSFPSNMLYAEMLDAVTRLYALNGYAAEAAALRETIRELSFGKGWFTTDDWFSDHLVRTPANELVRPDHVSESCQYYALFSHTASKADDARFYRRVMEELGPARAADAHTNICKSAMFLGSMLRLEALAEAGDDARLLADVKRYFLADAERTGTLWEISRDNVSLCHGYASYAAVLTLRAAFGIDRVDFAKREIVFRKPTSDLAHAEAELPLGGGTLELTLAEGVVTARAPKGWKIVGEAGSLLDAAWNDAVLRAAADHADALYAPNEEMVFKLCLEGVDELPKGAYFVRLDNLGDDGRAPTSRLVPLRVGEPIVIRDRIAKPGFVRYEALVVDGAGRCVSKAVKSPWGPPPVRVCFGAGASPDKLVPFPEPKDFDAFWKTQRERLAAVPLKADLKKVGETDAAEVFAVRVACAGSRPMTGYMAMPKAAKEGKKFPIDLSFHGYGTFMQMPMKGERADVIEISVNAHGYDLGRDAAYYKKFWSGVTRDEDGRYAMDVKENADPTTSYFNGIALRVMRAVAWAKTLPEWDGKKFRVWGGSQGGMQALWAAGLCTGITEVEAIVPWGCDWRGKTVGRFCFDKFHVPYAPGLDYYDTVYLARRIPPACTVNISRAGLGDVHCPPSGEWMLYNAIRAPKRIVFVQNSDHSGAPKGINQQTVYETGAVKSGGPEAKGTSVLGSY